MTRNKIKNYNLFIYNARTTIRNSFVEVLKVVYQFSCFKRRNIYSIRIRKKCQLLISSLRPLYRIKCQPCCGRKLHCTYKRCINKSQLSYLLSGLLCHELFYFTLTQIVHRQMLIICKRKSYLSRYIAANYYNIYNDSWLRYHFLFFVFK